MIKKYEVESIIKVALEELDGLLSKPKYEDGMQTVYEATVEEDGYGNLIFSFKEDCLSDDVDKYRIKIEYME